MEDPSKRLVAVQTLAIDATTAEVVSALDRAGVAHLLLKGPATVHWLFPDARSERPYSDVDLLVPPPEFLRAGMTLDAIGFSCVFGRSTPSDRPWMHGLPWRRDGSAEVDLHRGFHGVADRSAWWSTLASDAVEIEVARTPVRIPSRASCALIVGLHAVASPRTPQAANDLQVAVERFDVETWHEAARRAAHCGALEHLRLSVSRVDAPQRVREAVGDAAPATRSVPGTDFLVAVRAQTNVGADAPDVGSAINIVTAFGQHAPRSTLTIVRSMVLPARELLATRYAWASRSWAHHAAAVVVNLARIVFTTPRVARVLLRARRARPRG